MSKIYVNDPKKSRFFGHEKNYVRVSFYAIDIEEKIFYNNLGYYLSGKGEII